MLSRRVSSSCAIAASSASLSFSMPLASAIPWIRLFELTILSHHRFQVAVGLGRLMVFLLVGD